MCLAWIDHAAAELAVARWHYARALPMGPTVKVGAWEHGRFVGAVIFSRGASPALGARYGLDSTQVAELSRVALGDHATPCSRILRIACGMLKGLAPGLRLIVSFADPGQGHHGGIYQGAGWIYSGTSRPTQQFLRGGRWVHRRDAAGKSVFFRGHRRPEWKDLPRRTVPGKHRYLFPLDRATRDRVAPLAKPYPKRSEAPGPTRSDGAQEGRPAPVGPEVS